MQNKDHKPEKVETSEQDRALQELWRYLDVAYTRPQTPPWMTWATTRARFQEEQKAKTVRFLPRYVFQVRRASLTMRLGLGLALLLIILTAASAALSPLLRETLGFTPTAHQLVQNEQFTLLQQSATVNGKRITLNAAYADINQVILGMTIDPSLTVLPTLKTKQGEELPVLAIKVSGSKFGNSQIGEASIFDASGLPPSAAKFDLTLELGISNTQAVVTFNFTVPSHGGLVLTPDARATADGKTVTLTKVVVTPSSTLVIVQGLLNDTDNNSLQTGRLTAPDGSQFAQGRAAPADQGYTFLYYDSLLNKKGTWTFEINQRPNGLGTPVPGGAKVRNWIFHFQLSY